MRESEWKRGSLVKWERSLSAENEAYTSVAAVFGASVSIYSDNGLI